MNKMPTALEFLNEAQTNPTKGWTTHKLMIEFAKLHVEAALKEASKKARCCDDAIVDLDHTIIDAYVEKDSILNSYSLENIK